MVGPVRYGLQNDSKGSGYAEASHHSETILAYMEKPDVLEHYHIRSVLRTLGICGSQ